MLEQLDGEHWTACSPAHVARMRAGGGGRHIEVEEVGFCKDGVRWPATSWGPGDAARAAGVPDERLPDGLGLYLGVKPVVSNSAPMMVVSFGAHNALVKPERLVDASQRHAHDPGRRHRAGRG